MKCVSKGVWVCSLISMWLGGAVKVVSIYSNNLSVICMVNCLAGFEGYNCI